MKISRRNILIGSGGLLGIGYLSTIGAQTARADFANLSLSVSDVSVSTTDGTVSSVDVDGSQTDAIQLEWEGLESTDTADVELYANAPDQESSGSGFTRKPMTNNGNDVYLTSSGSIYKTSDETQVASVSLNKTGVFARKRPSYNQGYILVTDGSTTEVHRLTIDPFEIKSTITLDTAYNSGDILDFEATNNYFYITSTNGSATAFDHTGTTMNSLSGAYEKVKATYNSSVWLTIYENSGDITVVKYSSDLSTQENSYSKVVPENGLSVGSHGGLEPRDPNYFYVGGSEVARVEKSTGNISYTATTGSLSYNYAIESLIMSEGKSELYAKSNGRIAYINESDGSLNSITPTDTTAVNQSEGIDTTHDDNIQYWYMKDTFASENSNGDSTSATKGAEVSRLEPDNTDPVNEDLLVSGSISLNSLSGSFSGTFTDVFGSNPINIPSNHADLKKSHFEESTDGNTKTTDVTFRLRVVLQTAGIEDNDSNTATYSVTNS